MTKFMWMSMMIFWFLMFSCIFIILSMTMPIHPISLIIIIIIYNILICLNMSLWKNNFMFSIMIFLILISGLLIIFMYFSSLISNEKQLFYPNMKMYSLYTLNLLTAMMLLMKMDSSIIMSYSYVYHDIQPMNEIMSNNFNKISFLYTYPPNNMTLFTIIFLLLTFFSIIKINLSSYYLTMRKIKK